MSDTDITDEIRQKTTDDLILYLDQSAYTWGLMEGALIHAGPHAPTRWIRRNRDEECGDTMVAREELRNRLDEKKRAIDAGLDRERELRETVSDLRVALQHEQNQRAVAEKLTAADHVIRDTLDALGVSPCTDPVRTAKGMRARAESAEARVEELEGELADADSERGDLRAGNQQMGERLDELNEERDDQACRALNAENWAERVAGNNADLRAENERLTRERDEMKTDRTLWMQEAERLGAEVDRLRTAVPRVIEPSEVREGQTVAIQWAGDSWAIRSDISAELADAAHALMNPSKKIVLLEDAPEGADEGESERRGEVIDPPRPGDRGVVTHYRGIELPEVVPVQWHDGSWKAQDRFEDLAPASVTVRRAEPDRPTCGRPCACPESTG